MSAIVLEVHANDDPAKPLFYIGIIGDVWFWVPDASASEANGWAKVRCSERVWQSYAQRQVDKARIDVWTGKPRALNDDGTLK